MLGDFAGHVPAVVVVAVQDPDAVQQPAAWSRTDSQISTEVETESDFVLTGAEACETVQNEGMPLIGLEPITR